MLFVYLLAAYVLSFFMNVLIYRGPIEEKLFVFQSKCPSCKENIKWYNNIPIFGYFISGIKYKCCSVRKNKEILLVPICNMILYTLCFYFFKAVEIRIITMLFSSVLLIVIFTDINHLIILDRCHVAILVLGVLAIIFNFTSLINAVLGVLIFFLGFYLIAVIGEKIMDQEVLGGGDIKLMGACGLFLGWDLTLCGLIVGCAFGLLLEYFLMLIKIRKRGDYLAFGPYLALGMLFACFYGHQLIDWYQGLLLGLV